MTGKDAERLERAVIEACSEPDIWPARVAAAIRATLEFANAHPEAARSIAVEMRRSREYPRLIERFAELLAADAPAQLASGQTKDRGLVGGIATIVASRVRADRLDDLEDLAPELIYLALAPYVGFEEAKRWAGGGGEGAST